MSRSTRGELTNMSRSTRGELTNSCTDGLGLESKEDHQGLEAGVSEELFGTFVRLFVAHLAFLCTRPLLTRVCNRVRIFFGQFLTKNKDQLDLSVLYDSISLPPKSYFLLKL